MTAAPRAKPKHRSCLIALCWLAAAAVALRAAAPLTSLRRRRAGDLAALRAALLQVGDCLVLNDTCLDYGNLVVFVGSPAVAANESAAYHSNYTAPLLPQLYIGYKPYIGSTYEDSILNIAHARMGLLLPPPLRWSSHAEPEHLRRPHFAADSLPVLVFPFHPFNFGRVFEHLAGWLLNATAGSPARRAVRLIVAVPEGLAMPRFMRDVLGTLGFGSVTTLADASARSVQRGRPAQAACYREMLLCRSGAIINMAQLGQHVASHYAAAAHDGGRRAAPHERGVDGPINVLFSASLAQAAPLLREADVLVGMHGTGMANAWLMRPGSAAVEIMPLDAHRFPYSEITAEDPASRLRWYNLHVCDPHHSAPSRCEVERCPRTQARWALERHSSVPWPALRSVLAQAMAAPPEEYRRREAANANTFFLTPAGLRAGTPDDARLHCPVAHANVSSRELVMDGHLVNYTWAGTPRALLMLLAPCGAGPDVGLEAWGLGWGQLLRAALDVGFHVVTVTPLPPPDGALASGEPWQRPPVNGSDSAGSGAERGTAPVGCWPLHDVAADSVQVHLLQRVQRRIAKVNPAAQRQMLMLMGGPPALMAASLMRPTGVIYLSSPGSAGFAPPQLRKWMVNVSQPQPGPVLHAFPPTVIVHRTQQRAAQEASRVLDTLTQARGDHVPVAGVAVGAGGRNLSAELPAILHWIYDYAYDAYERTRSRVVVTYDGRPS
eukprot:scaffold5.g708.t1